MISSKKTLSTRDFTGRGDAADTDRSHKQVLDEEYWISTLKIYLGGDVAKLKAAKAKVCALIAPDYEVDQRGLLFFCPRSATEAEDCTKLARLVVPE